MMANPGNMSDEQYRKYLEELAGLVSKNSFSIPPAVWGWGPSPVQKMFWDIGEPTDEFIPLEQDENGTYGYKTLIRVPESKWFWSPNRFRFSEWVENRIVAHPYSPENHPHYGIYATKSLESLEDWYRAYHRDFSQLWYLEGTVELFAVRIRVWGYVVEHTTGFRAEFAEIDRVLFHGEWQDGHR